MFNKTKPRTAPAPQPQPAATPPLHEAPHVNMARTKPAAPASTGNKPFSSIGSGLLVEGNVTGTGDLHLDGTVRGDVKVGHLIVGESGNIEGKVEAESIEVRGRIVGSIQGRQIKLQATAYVEGDITHDQLAIDVGAFFQGRCLQNRRTEQAVSPVSLAAPAADIAPIQPAAPSLSTYDMSALADLK
ncbi:polymer-forming cytoskeletal protein [Asticcacaulis sp. EMRT-3]|uniref:bactofilin family protein n=1 Tax=Asticcacaulis sp. EMRT-3 TaxID=3040349 RepID=UPI0024AED13B|nr:polymer-forming cytoskeletal protein [Asticcacaulis sp. EMRT-3]MDI7774825.1 polymer-forming cytoskeletal protein [Asticcacaulis sp. EMRT-3]